MAKSSTGLSLKQKKELAEALYLKTDLTQKEIAQKVDISPNSMSNWVREGHWDELRQTLLTMKTTTISQLYKKLAKLVNGDDDDEDAAKNADAILKITGAIKNLEDQKSIADIAEVAKMFTDWMMPFDHELALLVMEHFDKFIKAKLKKA